MFFFDSIWKLYGGTACKTNMEPGKSPLWKGKQYIHGIIIHSFSLCQSTYLAVQLTTSTCSLKIISQPLQRENAQSSLLVVIAERSIFGHQLKRTQNWRSTLNRGSHGDSSAAGGFGSAKARGGWIRVVSRVLEFCHSNVQKWSGCLGQMPATWLETCRPPVSNCLTNRWTSTNFTVSGSCWRYFAISPTYRTRLDSSHATIFLTPKSSNMKYGGLTYILREIPTLGAIESLKRPL